MTETPIEMMERMNERGRFYDRARDWGVQEWSNLLANHRGKIDPMTIKYAERRLEELRSSPGICFNESEGRTCTYRKECSSSSNKCNPDTCSEVPRFYEGIDRP